MRRALLFDLDGTLVDTAPDMVQALDRLLGEQGREASDYAFARAHVSRGALGLVQAGFPDVQDEASRETLRQRFLELYGERVCRDSVLFDGLDPILRAVEAAPDLTWGVVTNKPRWLAEPLLEAMGLRARSACLVCGDTLARRKPHPDPLLHACELLDVAPAQSVYVGDDKRDVLAARAAAMPSIAAGWGYIGPGESAHAWGADWTADAPGDLGAWLTRAGWLHVHRG